MKHTRANDFKKTIKSIIFSRSSETERCSISSVPRFSETTRTLRDFSTFPDTDKDTIYSQ